MGPRMRKDDFVGAVVLDCKAVDALSNVPPNASGR